MEKKNPKQEIGVLGEEIAVSFLKDKGFSVISRNYRKKYGEIDIIAEKGNILHFIEVKTLAEACGGLTSAIAPEEKVDFLKQRKIIKMAESWLMEKKIPFTAKWQIDVIAIQIDLDSKKAKIRFFENAVCQRY